MSDAFPSVPVADSEGGAIVGLRRFQSRFMLAGGDDVDVGAGGAFGGSGEDEGADDTAERVDAIEYTFSLQASRIVAVIQIFEHRVRALFSSRWASRRPAISRGRAHALFSTCLLLCVVFRARVLAASGESSWTVGPRLSRANESQRVCVVRCDFAPDQRRTSP